MIHHVRVHHYANLRLAYTIGLKLCDTWKYLWIASMQNFRCGFFSMLWRWSRKHATSSCSSSETERSAQLSELIAKFPIRNPDPAEALPFVAPQFGAMIQFLCRSEGIQPSEAILAQLHQDGSDVVLGSQALVVPLLCSLFCRGLKISIQLTVVRPDFTCKTLASPESPCETACHVHCAPKTLVSIWFWTRKTPRSGALIHHEMVRTSLRSRTQ